MIFEDALDVILGFEGSEFTDDPHDHGGATRWGITQQTLATWRGHEVSKDDVRQLTSAEAADIYKARYWDICRCGELPSGLDLLVFDTAVNNGPGRAIQLLQRAAGAKVDGVLGPRTMASVKALEPWKAIDEFAARRAVLYAGLQKEYWLGWYRRLITVHRLALKAEE